MAKTETTENVLGQQAQGWTQYAKDAATLQLKTAQLLFDTTARLTQTFADYYQTQAAESLKLSQACFNTGKDLAGEVRRQVTAYAEKTTAV